MRDASIIYFSVDNGDMSLIRLSDGTDIIIDCNVTNESLDESNQERYDIHNYLLKTLKKDTNNKAYIDAFILTHPDEDHCRGFDKIFYLGDPDDFETSDRDDGLISINELWFTPRVFAEYKKDLSTSAKAFLDEAKRRTRIYKDEGVKGVDSGDRLRIIGDSEEKDLEGLEKITAFPGSSVNIINSSRKQDFSIFIHAPFKEDIDPDNGERNDSSVVFQARFDINGVKNSALAIFGGDAGCSVWKDILRRSKESDLQWDLFLAPHHCSWSFFNEQDYKINNNVSEEAMKILMNGREGAIVIASCKPIKDNDDNPPHYIAAEKYKEIVGRNNFYVTSDNPNENLEFRMTINGPQKKDFVISKAIVSSSAIHSVTGIPKTYGR